jgi:hypothetical protein
MPPKRRSEWKIIMQSDALRMGLVILIALGGYFVYTSITQNATATSGRPPAPFEPQRVVQADASGPKVVRYGPAELTVETGSRVVLPGTGAFFGTEVKLERGRVRARVDHLGDGRHFAVRTFNCVAGVRGTEFVVSIVEGAGTIVDVRQGIVQVASLTGDSVMVRAGQRSVVTVDLLPELYVDPSEYSGKQWTLPPIDAEPAVPAGDPIPMEDATERPVEAPSARNLDRAEPVSGARASSSEVIRREISLDPSAVNPVVVPAREIAPTNVQPRSF